MRGTCRASCGTTGRHRPDAAVCLRAGCSHLRLLHPGEAGERTPRHRHLGGSSRRDPWLGLTKRRLAVRLDSGALRGDAASSFTCANMAMAATVLVGLVLNALCHWWWAENLAALVFLVWMVGETCKVWEDTRAPGVKGAQADSGPVVAHASAVLQ